MNTIRECIDQFLYEACGNTFLIVPICLTSFRQMNVMRDSPFFVRALLHLYEQYPTDSILVLSGDILFAEMPHMSVFDPRGRSANLSQGAWSTMCGNGARAVVRFCADRGWGIWKDTQTCLISTASGVLHGQLHSDGSISVAMGEASFRRTDLSPYLTAMAWQGTNSLFDLPVSSCINESIGSERISIGLNGYPIAGKIDGEPHLAIRMMDGLTLSSLEKKAAHVGSIILQRSDIFPSEINTNLYSVQSIDTQKNILSLMLCTYERGVYYVTRSCGTGTTLVAADMFQRLGLSEDWTCEILTLGGVLHVTRRDGIYSLAGQAFRTIMEKR